MLIVTLSQRQLDAGSSTFPRTSGTLFSSPLYRSPKEPSSITQTMADFTTQKHFYPVKRALRIHMIISIQMNASIFALSLYCCDGELAETSARARARRVPSAVREHGAWPWNVASIFLEMDVAVGGDLLQVHVEFFVATGVQLGGGEEVLVAVALLLDNQFLRLKAAIHYSA